MVKVPVYRIAALSVAFVVLVSCSRSKETYLAQGNEFLKKEKHNEASLAFKRAIQKDGNYVDAYLGFATSEIKRRRFERAIAALKRVIAIAPNQPHARTMLADLYMAAFVADPSRSDEYLKEVEDQAGALLRLDSHSFDGERLTGQLLLHRQRIEEAKAHFVKADAIQPGNAEVAVALGQILMHQGDKAASEKLLLKALETNPGNGGPYAVLYALYRTAGRVPEAEAVLRKQITARPGESEPILQLAAHQAQAQNPNGVDETLRPLLHDRTRFPSGVSMAAEFLARRGRADDAVNVLENAAASDPAAKLDHLKQVSTIYLRSSQPEKALSTLDRVLKESPEDQAAIASRSKLFIGSGDSAKLAIATRDLRELVSKNPDDPSFRFGLAQALLAGEDPAGATGQLREAVRRRGDYLPARLMLTELAYNDRRYGEVLRFADEILRIQPSHSQALVLKAGALSGLNRAAEARPILTAILASDPQHRTARIAYALMVAGEGRPRDAEKDLLALYESDRKDLRPLEAMVTIALSQGQGDQVIAYLSRELDRSPRRDAVRMLLAQTAVQTNNTDLAINQFAQVAFGSRKHAVQIRIAELQFRKGDRVAALKTMKEVTTAAPGDSSAAATYATLLDMSGRAAEAEAAYRKVLQLDPANATAMNNLAYLLAQNGKNLDEAQDWAEKATRRDPQAAFSDTLGWIYLKKGLTDSAIQIFTKAVAANPKAAVFRYHLAMAYKARGDSQRARNELTLALKAGANSSEEQQIKQLLAEMN